MLRAIAEMLAIGAKTLTMDSRQGAFDKQDI